MTVEIHEGTATDCGTCGGRIVLMTGWRGIDGITVWEHRDYLEGRPFIDDHEPLASHLWQASPGAENEELG